MSNQTAEEIIKYHCITKSDYKYPNEQVVESPIGDVQAAMQTHTKQRLTALKEAAKDLDYRSIWDDDEEILLIEREELLNLIEEELQ